MTRTLSTQAATAKAIRTKLKQVFPTVTFKVTSDAFSGGNSVDIRWTDGPTTAQVNAIAHWHQEGRFDGMIDLYEYTNRHPNLPQSKYVQTQRDYSLDARIAAIAYVNNRFGWDLKYTIREQPAYRVRKIEVPAHTWLEINPESNKHTGHGWQDMEVNALLQNTSMLCRHCSAATLPGDIYCPQCGNTLVECDEFGMEVA